MTCPTGSWTAATPNPHVLTGALVNGPQQPNDLYVDSRQNNGAAVSIAYNAGYSGAASPHPVLQALHRACCTAWWMLRSFARMGQMAWGWIAVYCLALLHNCGDFCFGLPLAGL